MKREIKIGLTLLAALAVFYLSITWLSRTQLFAPEEKYYSLSFENVNGLLEGDPVLIRGYISGRVLLIEPKSEFVRVEIALDKKANIYEDATAEIQIKELMGGKQIAIQPGISGKELMSGGTIKGKIALDFSSSFSQFGSVMDSVNPTQINTLITKLDQLITGLQTRLEPLDAKRVDRLFGQSENALSQLNTALYEVNQKITSNEMDSLIKGLNAGLKHGNLLIQDVRGLVEKFGGESIDQVEASLKQLPDLMEDLSLALKQINDLTRKLNESNSLANRLLTDESLSLKFDTTLYNLNKTLEQIHSKRVIVGLKRKKKDN